MKRILYFLQRPYLYILIILFGIVVKFVNLDKGFFWFDEVCTIQHTSGIPLYKYPEFIPFDEIQTKDDYIDLIRLNKQNLKLGKQLKDLRHETNMNPQHYVFLAFWHRIVGDNPIHYRYFSLLMFIFCLPLLYLLTKKIFESSLAGWVVVSLFAISPFIDNYAQEARYYILWTFMLLLINYLFLLATEHQRLKFWIFYSVSGVISLYTSPLSGLVMIGHFIYVLIFHRKLTFTILINQASMLLLYLPWLILLFNNREEIHSSLAWTVPARNINLLDPLLLQLVANTKMFFDNQTWHNLVVWIFFKHKTPAIILISVIEILLAILIVLSFYHLYRYSSKKVFWFMKVIVLPNVLFFHVADLIRNSFSSGLLRYQIITMMGVLLVVGFFISNGIQKGRITNSILYILIAGLGFSSLFLTIEDKSRWIHPNSDRLMRDASVLAQKENSLIITDFSDKNGLGLGSFISVINKCETDTIAILRVSTGNKDIERQFTGRDFSGVYVYDASSELVDNLKSQFGRRMDSVTFEGISPMWIINPNKRSIIK